MKTKISNIILLTVLVLIISWLTSVMFIGRKHIKQQNHVPVLQDTIKLKTANTIKIEGNGYIKIVQTINNEYLSGEINKNIVQYKGDTLIIKNTKHTHNALIHIKKLNTLYVSNNVILDIEDVKTADTLIINTENNVKVKVKVLNCKHLITNVYNNSSLHVENYGQKRCKTVNMKVKNSGYVSLKDFKNVEITSKVLNNGKLKID